MLSNFQDAISRKQIFFMFRWTRPPEEGERTDNEDQDEDVDEDAAISREVSQQ